jgi:drug/metabolite transporter (DMT)-like permease
MMVLVLGSLYFRQKLARRQWAGMLVAMAGALLIVLKGNVLGMARCSSAGDLLVLAAGLCWAVYTLGLRTLLPGLDALVMMMVLLLVGEFMLLPAFVQETWQAGGFHPLSLSAGAALLYLGIFPSVLAFLMYNRAIAQVGAAKAAGFLYLMPAFGAVQSIAARRGVALVSCGWSGGDFWRHRAVFAQRKGQHVQREATLSAAD